jgi:hypothetical protein
MIPPMAGVVLAVAATLSHHAVPDRAPHAVVTPARTALRGVASWMPERYGSRYLALPQGPGHRVRICGSASCIVRTSTDAGPSKAMQRLGRLVDLSVRDFERICGCSRSVGLARVTIQVVD